MDLSAMRRQYRCFSLRSKDLKSHPIDQFASWFDEAQQNHLSEPNAFILATASADGAPSCRTVLMKHFDQESIFFFTNYKSQKAQELKQNPRASGVFLWIEMERQVRFEGSVTQVSREESEHYFSKRPRGSQIGAWASPQSRVISSRKVLEQAAVKYEEQFKGEPIPCPPFWGGYRIAVERWEFWQGREDRLHDRFEYQKKAGRWEINRLAP